MLPSDCARGPLNWTNAWLLLIRSVPDRVPTKVSWPAVGAVWKICRVKPELTDANLVAVVAEVSKVPKLTCEVGGTETLSLAALLKVMLMPCAASWYVLVPARSPPENVPV